MTYEDAQIIVTHYRARMRAASGERDYGDQSCFVVGAMSELLVELLTKLPPEESSRLASRLEPNREDWTVEEILAREG